MAVLTGRAEGGLDVIGHCIAILNFVLGLLWGRQGDCFL